MQRITAQLKSSEFVAGNPAAVAGKAAGAGLEFYRTHGSRRVGRPGGTGVVGRLDGDAAAVDGNAGIDREVEGVGGPAQAPAVAEGRDQNREFSF